MQIRVVLQHWRCLQAALLIGLIFVSACGKTSRDSASNDQQGVTKCSLRLKWLYDPGFAGELVAAKTNIFAKHGLEVAIHPGGFEADPIKLVATAADTFGVAGADSFLIARSKGIPIIAFAAGYIQTPVVYYSHEDANINTPADFKGKRVGYQAGQDTATIYESLLTAVNLKRSDVIEVPIKYDFSPFLNRQIDVWPGYAATQSYILHQKGIPYRVIRPSDFGVNYVGTLYFTTEKLAREQPGLVRQFRQALIEGWELTYADEAKAIDAISSFDPKTLTPDLIRWNLEKQLPSIKPEGKNFCEIPESNLREMVPMLKAAKLLTSEVEISDAILK